MATHANTCPWGNTEPQAYAPPAAKGYTVPPSSVQTILYGGDSGRAYTPPKGGKKAVHTASQRPSPFAQWSSEPEEIYPTDYHARSQKKALQDASMNKVGAQGFDPSIYRNNLESNFTNIQTSRARAHGVANFLSHSGQEVPSGAPTVSGEKVGFKGSAPPAPGSYAGSGRDHEGYAEDYENYHQ